MTASSQNRGVRGSDAEKTGHAQLFSAFPRLSALMRRSSVSVGDIQPGDIPPWFGYCFGARRSGKSLNISGRIPLMRNSARRMCQCVAAFTGLGTGGSRRGLVPASKAGFERTGTHSLVFLQLPSSSCGQQRLPDGTESLWSVFSGLFCLMLSRRSSR